MAHPRRHAAVPTVAGLVIVACLGVPPVTAAAADGCSTQSVRDLNGDGFDDAVVGDPYATVAGRAEAGAVVVLYGDGDGRIGEGRRVRLSQASVPGSSLEKGDHFGWSVAVDDADGDGCADLVVGSPGEDWAGHADAGIVHVISFTPGGGGPGAARAVVIDQGDVAGAVESGDQFGSAVAVSNYRGDDEAIGAIGAPGEDLRGVVDAGVVNTFSYNGVPFQTEQREQGRLSVPTLPGTAEAGDRFGASVIISPLEVTDGTDTGIEPTIVAGAPGDTVRRSGATALDNAGSVTAWEPVTGFQQLLTQDSPGVPGTAETGDQFGYSLAFAEPSTSAGAEHALAVGSPREDVGSVADAGSVTLLDDVAGAGLQGGVTLTQNTKGFDGTAEPGDRFGHSVALRPTSASSSLLVIGAPFEDVGSVADAGMVQTVAVSRSAGTATPVRSYTENSSGTPGRVARSNRFGLTVAAMDGLHENVFTVSSPYQGSGSVFVVDQDGRARSWVPGAGGVPTLTAGRFGWSVSGLGSE